MKNIVGDRFGKLIAVRPVAKNASGNMEWVFVCDCGKEKVIDASHVRRGNTISCGCHRRNRKNLVGDHFSHLTVLEMMDGTKRKNAKCRCLCDCGQQTEVAAKDLRNGHTKSCGHCDAMSLLDDLTGKTFGNVTIIQRVASQNPDASRWLYRCVCGREKETYRNSLVSGQTTSCGCVRRFDWQGVLYRSRMEVFTAMTLQVLGLRFEYEKNTFHISLNGEMREYTPDFHLLDGDSWIEVKGTTFREGIPKFIEFQKTHRATLINQSELQTMTNRSLGHLYREWLRGPEACYETIKRGLSDITKREKSKKLITGGE